LGGEDARAQEHVVAVAEGAEDADTVLGHASVDDALEEVRSLIHDMSRNQTTHAVGYDGGSSLIGGDIWSIAR
jgi:hypothetical protein